MSGERIHKIMGPCGQGKQAIKYPADVAKEKLLDICKPEYWGYIEKHLAGDFACEIVSQLSKVTEENRELLKALNDIRVFNRTESEYYESEIERISYVALTENKTEEEEG